MEEIWKDIEGSNGKYQVSNTGHVRSFTKWKNGELLKPRKEKKGYLCVEVNGGKYCRIHRLVAQAFIPNPENKPQVNHKDLDKENNHVDNLEWSTQPENMAHAVENGVYKVNHKMQNGETNSMAKLTIEEVLRFRELFSQGFRVGEIANMYPQHGRSNIGSIIRRKSWIHI